MCIGYKMRSIPEWGWGEAQKKQTIQEIDGATVLTLKIVLKLSRILRERSFMMQARC